MGQERSMLNSKSIIIPLDRNSGSSGMNGSRKYCRHAQNFYVKIKKFWYDCHFHIFFAIFTY